MHGAFLCELICFILIVIQHVIYRIYKSQSVLLVALQLLCQFH